MTALGQEIKRALAEFDRKHGPDDRMTREARIRDDQPLVQPGDTPIPPPNPPGLGRAAAHRVAEYQGAVRNGTLGSENGDDHGEPSTGGNPEGDDAAGHGLEDFIAIDPDLREPPPDRKHGTIGTEYHGENGTPHTPGADEQETHGSWRPVDLRSALGKPPARATLLGGLMYPGLRHLISGPPEALKTWVAMIAAAEQLASGGRVVWINTDGAQTSELAGRLAALGATGDALDAFLLVNPEGPGDVDALVEAGPALTVLDSVEPTGELFSLNTNSSGEVQTLYRKVLQPFHAAGVTTAWLDHVVKDQERQGRYSTGSGRKLALVDVHLGLKVVGKPLSRDGGTCTLKVYLHKDRPGGIRRGETANSPVAKITFDAEPGGGRITYTITADPDVWKEDGGFRPTGYMEKVSRHLEKHGLSSTNQVERAGLGNREHVSTALRLLVDEDFVTVEQGPRNARLHKSITPFRDVTSDIRPTSATPPPGGGHHHLRSSAAPLEGAEVEVSDEDPNTSATSAPPDDPSLTDWRAEL